MLVFPGAENSLRCSSFALFAFGEKPCPIDRRLNYPRIGFRMNESPTGIVRDERYLAHHMGPGHPESPGRLEAIHAMLDREPGLPLKRIEARPATREEIETVHAPDYFEYVASTAGRDYVPLDADTAATSRTFETALLAAGGVMEAAEAVLRGDAGNAMALVRPPGHHAEFGQAKGFCFFNNVAIAAAHLLNAGGLSRILVADWDLHHGNGTQHAFYARRDVLFFSTHQSPYYPGTGSWDETGRGEGEGFTVNVPLRPGKADGDYRFLYRNLLGPIAEAYEPEFILVSAGFDIGLGDPLGGMRVSAEGFAALAAEVKALADSLCRGRLVLVLEGGYDRTILADGVRAVLRQLTKTALPPSLPAEPSLETQKEIMPVFDIQRRFWPL
jgi:acetoin utilization deacetylase AcuC-like enzyme